MTSFQDWFHHPARQRLYDRCVSRAVSRYIRQRGHGPLFMAGMGIQGCLYSLFRKRWQASGAEGANGV
jgi:hypothetical protein